MEKELHVLIVEDLPSDAELAERELRTVLKNYTTRVVDTEIGFVKALKTFKPDLIVSDYQMPTFNGLSALKIRQKKAPFIPFIILTGSMNEDTAVECMKEGADDYVIKEHIQRLGLAVLNALENKKNEQERKQAVEALQASEEKFRNFVETSPDLVFRLSKTGYIDYVSSRVEDLYGYKPDELIGKHLKTTTPVGEIPKAIKAISMVFTGEQLKNLEINQKAKSGRIIPMEINAVPVYQVGKVVGLQGIMRDVSERKQAEEEIRKLSTAVQQSPSVIAITDIKGNLEYVNPKFTELTGYSYKEAIGQNPRILKSDDQPDKMFKKLWKTISSGKKWRGEFHNKKKNGELFWEAASISPIFNEKGKITNYVKVAEDITERKQLEQVQLVLYNIAEAVNTTKNLDELYKIIHQQLGNIIDATNFYIANYNEETDEIYSPYFMKENVHNNMPHKFRNNGVSNYIIKNAKPLFLTEELRKELINKGEIADYVWTSKTLIGVPLKIEKKIVGCMVVRSKKEESKFTEKDLSILELISYQIALAIERKQAEEELRNSEEKFRTYAENVPGVVSIYTRFPDDKVVFHYQGPGLEEIIGKKLAAKCIDDPQEYFKLIPKEDREKLEAASEIAIKNNEPLDTEYRLEISKKEFIWIRTRFNVTCLSEGAFFWQGIIYEITEQKQAEEQIKKDLKIKTALLQEIYHRTRNNMQLIISMLKIQTRSLENRSLTEDEGIDFLHDSFNDVINKIKSMSLVHEKLYQAKDLSHINLKEYIKDIVRSLMISFSIRSENVMLKLELEDVFILIDSAIPLGLVLNEIISNVFKHAFPHTKNDELFIKLYKEEDETINIHLSDNGIGIPSDIALENTNTMGLQTVFSLTEHQLNGEVKYEIENGLKWHIKFKDNLHKERV